MRLSNITKTYGDITVFDNFSAELKNGKVTQISGESGCGKTTLLRIIAGLEDFSGEIYDRPAGKISAVFQENRLFEELSALENCHLVLKGKPAFDIAEALVSTGLSREDITRPVRELSGGMKRRTAIVRSICADFGILLLDEPFKGIDNDNKLRTAELIKAHIKDKTVLFVTHETDLLPLEPHTVLKLCGISKNAQKKF
ncbi:MAG: ATP-binding cassette domain-containing protein [Huintestinicola sp.]